MRVNETLITAIVSDEENRLYAASFDLETKLLNVSGVVQVDIGEGASFGSLIVLLSCPDARQQVPAQFEGYPVSIKLLED